MQAHQQHLAVREQYHSVLAPCNTKEEEEVARRRKRHKQKKKVEEEEEEGVI